MILRHVLCLSALALFAGIVPAQAQTLTAGGTIWQPRSLLLSQGNREEISGVFLGGTIGVRVGKFVLEGSGLRGTLTPVAGSPAVAREGGEIRLQLGFHPAHWFGLESGYVVRAFDSPVGYQRWQMPSFAARLSARLGSPALGAYLRAGILPRVSVTGQPPARGAIGEAGLILRPRLPVEIRASYRVEHFNFADGRAERLDGIAATVSVRLGDR